MKRPMPPPDVDGLIEDMLSSSPHKLAGLMIGQSGPGPADHTYLPWDKIRFKKPPEGLDHEEWWITIKLARRQMMRRLPLLDMAGRHFSFTLPDPVLKALEQISRDASGKITISEQVTNPGTRDRYLVNSLIEEAIHSSQLEGAATSRKVAKDMLRTGRTPRTRDERMIVNNYRAMRMIGEIKDAPLTPDLICEIHRIVTDGTLDSPEASGRFQLPGEERVMVLADDGEVLHVPPPAGELPERVARLCRFANGELDDGSYVPPVLRAITLHFMIGYDHPFEDGNGRTARALFYWSMLKEGFWLTEFVAISQILKNAPVRYAESYLHSEDDESDLTYFHLYQLQVLQRSIENLHQYLARKSQEVRELQRKISGAGNTFNHRQTALLEHALKNPGASVTARSHMTSHNVVYETARQDLIALEERGLFVKQRRGNTFEWTPVPDLDARLHRLDGE
ncbi:Fic family protein [Streptomyces uncialis]|uniref:Fic family protein n=1 Tax=Streptomyces uncialis TaxID=1048205 RepID=UPI002E2F210A|nr:Fic family protein [Streptomyces uncialis]WTE12344.1 Fic family protein [Streptomyces uncialis]